jgi:hypothetical protein
MYVFMYACMYVCMNKYKRYIAHILPITSACKLRYIRLTDSRKLQMNKNKLLKLIFGHNNIE